MSITQYQIFVRYYNDKVNRILTNQIETQWVSAEEYITLEQYFYTKKYNATTFNYTITPTENYKEYEEIIKYLSEPNYAYNKDDILYKYFEGKVLKVEDLSVQQYEIYTKGKRYNEILKLEKDKKMAQEYCLIEPKDSMYLQGSNQEQKNKITKAKLNREISNYEIIINESLATNPKYDMVFMYDGIAYLQAEFEDYNPDPKASAVYQNPYIYYDRMKRIKLDPWFLISTHASLNSAMIRAKELINILGKDGVKIGKVVPLDQYIEIV